MMKKLLVGIIVIGVLFAAVVLVTNRDVDDKAGTQVKQKPAPLVVTEIAKAQDISRTLELTGSVSPTKVAQMISAAEGPILHCRVREGDNVRSGQALVTIGRRLAAQAAVASAREELSRQADELRRTDRLVQSGAIAGEELDVARANYKKAESQLAAAELGLADYEIAAPWAGIVSVVWVAEGDYVAPRAKLVEIFDPASLVVQFEVPEKHSAGVKAGAKIVVNLDAYPRTPFQATITRVYPQLDPQTRTRTVEATIREAVNLLPGMFARVSLVVEAAQNAVVIPDSAVLVTPKGDEVAFVVQDNKASLRRVRTGIEAGHNVQIVEGIQPGERVVTSGNQGLKDGETVKLSKSPKRSEPKAAADGGAR
ncbi:efflux RND transporter periplasmic adaptor subunit [bacterium]|nr:efflux RND transporter periplasmic adaptor subunit [bacterium]